MFGVCSGEVETGAAAGGDGARVHAVGRLGAGAVGVLVGELRPERGGELGSGRVVGAHEERPLSGAAHPRGECVERLAVEVDVATATVAAGAATADQSDVLEHVEVMGEEVRWDVDAALQFARGAVRSGQFVDDGQSHGIAQRCVPGAAQISVLVGGHPGQHLTQQTLSQYLSRYRRIVKTRSRRCRVLRRGEQPRRSPTARRRPSSRTTPTVSRRGRGPRSPSSRRSNTRCRQRQWCRDRPRRGGPRRRPLRRRSPSRPRGG